MKRASGRHNWGFSQTYLLGSFVRHAQRSSQVLFRLRKERLDSLWGLQPLSLLLSLICSSPLSSAFGWMARVRSSGLPSGRSVPGACLLDRSGFGSRRKHAMPDPQRAHPAAVGAERVSASGHAAKLLAAFWPEAPAQAPSRPRQTSGRALRPPGRSLQRHGGCRYHDAGHLRVSRGGRSRLYSQAAPHAAHLRSHPVHRGSEWAQSGAMSSWRGCIRL